LGKLLGVFGSVLFVTRAGFANLRVGSTRLQVFGIALLCGIGFTMSLFIGALTFPNDQGLQNTVKIAILAGSVLTGSLGWCVLRWAPEKPSRKSAG
jgi:Na+:H+ antiporter, NhaA family